MGIKAGSTFWGRRGQAGAGLPLAPVRAPEVHWSWFGCPPGQGLHTGSQLGQQTLHGVLVMQVGWSCLVCPQKGSLGL